MKNVELAEQHAFQRLTQGLSPRLAYHSVAHTLTEVVPAAERFAALEGLGLEARELLRTAAFYHDTGFTETYEGHEEASVAIARQSLPRFGYTQAEVDAIGEMIMATRLPQSPQGLAGMILADADLDVLGQEAFFERNAALRSELAVFRAPVDDETWWAEQIDFLQGHRYFTDSARRLRDGKKQANLERLQALLAVYRKQQAT